VRIAYVHGIAGVSGLGLLGALVDLGASLAAVQEGWQRLQLPHMRVTVERCPLADYTATRLSCSVPAANTWLSRYTDDSLVSHIDQSALAPRIKRRLTDVLVRFANAVAAVQRSQDPNAAVRSPYMPSVLYLGSGICTALDALGIDQFLTSPVNLGDELHPVIMALLQGMPVYGETAAATFVTVDGAAMLAGMADGFGPLPSMTLTATGYGALAEGTEDMRSLQVVLGDTAGDQAADRIAVLEANIDDMNPEFYEAVFERLLARGALDVTLTPLLMKKGRPANKLTVLAPLAATASLARAILHETSTFGVRIYEAWRQKLERFWRPVETCYGAIPIKCGVLDGRIVQAAPEYEACKRLAQEHGVPLRLVYAEASRLAAPWLQESDRQEG
jgi:uncharacterized protein (DUF111 family)